MGEIGMNDPAKLRIIYDTMVRIRQFEQSTKELFENNKIRGSIHLCTGQEAIAATVCANLNPDDYITSTHRGHGHCIAKGASIERMYAELFGKENGYCGGRGGSMHIADFSKGNLGAYAIVGTGLPIAVGAALAAQIKGTRQVAMAFFGDGAANQGIAHECMNLAGLWKLPVIFVCENNKYAISVSYEKSTAAKHLSDRAIGYGMEGYRVDGNDVLELDKVFVAAILKARNGEGPSLIECMTDRWYGHWIGDPEVYRNKEEVEQSKERCPIKRLGRLLVEAKILVQNDLINIADTAQMEIRDAIGKAQDGPYPDAAGALGDVFVPGAIG
jgi:pyruvate dehydrogenase E1 component alpha subunit